MRQHQSIKMQFRAITLLCTCIGFTPPSKTQLRAPTRQFAAPDVTATAQAYDALGIAQVLDALTERIEKQSQVMNMYGNNIAKLGNTLTVHGQAIEAIQTTQVNQGNILVQMNNL